MDARAIVSFLFLFQCDPVFGWRPFVMRVENFTLETYHPKIFDLNISVFEVDGTQYFSGSLNILRTVNNIYGHFVITTDAGNGQYEMVYLNKTFDLCQLLKFPKMNALFEVAKKVAKSIIAQTKYDRELISQCPIRKKFVQLFNATIDANSFPPFLPEIKAKVTGLTWLQENKVKTYLYQYAGYINFFKTFKSKLN